MWFEIANAISIFRPSIAYDSINDKLHIVSGSSAGIIYRRFTITRDSDNNITDIQLDSDFTSLSLDGNSGGTCTSFDGQNPIVLFKNTGTNGILVAF